MIVVPDTNVVISGILTPRGAAGQVVDRWVDGAFTVAVSPALIGEYIGVLQRPKFRAAGSVAARTSIVAALLDLANTVTVLPQALIDIITEDPSDNRILECAAAAGATHIVSGDQHLLELKRFGAAPILGPADFLKALAAYAPETDEMVSPP